ncbi:unnamed protein product [Bursaphelenchus xylophilus]|uniref:(pine wood nematode) hypothetical protein n=1 Tax=Bursaphelenchus xylophilus TaxID=6326 RepID=A0A1I7SHK0_BURXY|nr:unnamed protein product [Bursaphelenchus xylophilus]CAG9092091.1 unnamed protein product [Bursaphelenchus xylophilus]
MTINLLIEKCREWDLPLHMVFIDFKKAFDSIKFVCIWRALEECGVDECTVRMIQQLYAAGRSYLCLGSSQVEFEVQRGVRQGDSLSPSRLYCLFLLCNGV